MTFGAPWMLLGLAAALIPLLIHLFDRRRPRRVPFAALAFVLRSQRRTASRLKLKRILLYALRTLIFLAIPLALAQPRWRHGAKVTSTRGLAATAVVLDQSFALRWSDGRPLFARAQEEARAAIRALAPEEPASLILCGERPAIAVPLGFDRGGLFTALQLAAPGYRPAALNQCLESAAGTLDASPLGRRRLIVVSAATATSLRLDVSPPRAHLANGQEVVPDIDFLDIAPTSLPNRALVGLRAEPVPELGLRSWRFTALTRSFASGASRDAQLNLEIDGAVVAKSFLNLEEQGTTQKVFTYDFPGSGVFEVTARLARSDALAEDDHRSLIVNVPRPTRALLINGAPSSQKYRDEAYFVESALAASGSPVKATTRDPDAAWNENLMDFDALFLLNVAAPSSEHVQRIERFLSKGGGVFLSVGDNVNPEAWNAAAGWILPRKFRVVKTAGTTGIGVRRISQAHPIMAPFVERAREGLFAARFLRFMLLEPGEADAAPAEPLVVLDDGALLLVASQRGKGRILFFVSTVDRDWNDLVLTPSFLPLIQRSAGWLSGTLDRQEPLQATVGEPTELATPDSQLASGVKAPSGAILPVVVTADGTSQTPPLREPGRYRVLEPDETTRPELDFFANIEPTASDTTRIPETDLKTWTGQTASIETATVDARRRAFPAWTFLFMLAAVAFFIEGVLVRK